MPRVSQTYEFLIIVLGLAGMGIAGLVAMRRGKGYDTSGYFLAGRTIGPLALGVSLAVTTLWGVWSLSIGMPVSFGLGGWIVLGAVAIVGLLLLGFVFAPIYRTADVVTVPAFLRGRYGSSVGLAAALVSIVLTLVIRIPFTILVGSRFLNLLFGWELMSSALLLIVIPGLFVVAGGYPAIIASQGVGGIAAGAGLIFLAFNGFSYGETFPHPIFNESESSWVPLLTGMSVIGVWFMCIDQFVVQRAFAARSCATIRSASGLAAVLVGIGVVAFAAGFKDPLIVANPVAGSHSVASGFIGGGVIAFVMASLSSDFMALSTLFTMDVVYANRTRTGEAVAVLVGRLSNTGIVILAILAASSVAFIGAGNINLMVQGVTAAVPPLVAVMSIGLLWPRMHRRGAIWALCVGWITALIQFGLQSKGIGEMMQGSVVTFVVTALVFVMVSLASPRLRSLGRASGTFLEKGLEVRKP